MKVGIIMHCLRESKFQPQTACDVDKMKAKIIEIYPEYFTISGILKQIKRML